MLKRMNISIRLWLLVLVAVVALLALAGEALSILRQTMLNDRQINERNVVESAYGVVAHYGDLAAAQKLRPEQARAQALAVLRGLRYGNNEYFWVNTIEPRMVTHPMMPELDGTDLSDFKDPNGKRIFVEFARVAQRSGGGFVDYYWPKPGADEPVAKISYVKLYAPWGWIIGSGIYLDDVDQAFKAELAKLGGFAFLALLVIGLAGSGIKLAGDALYRLNRKLRAIRDFNQLLVRTEDEQTLLDAVCRIACDKAGYRMAWVGFAEHDDANSIRPVAWAGVDGGYIANAKLSWADDTERGLGPAGRAIRSGETIYSRDLLTDPQMQPWHESVLQHGYRSAIALPLKDTSAHVFGVLLIYSAKRDAISPDEKRLLEELADDLAYGIVALRTRAEHKRAEEALKESNAKYRRIVETASEGIWLVDHDIRTVFVNARMAEMLGYSGDEMIGRLFTDFMFEEDVLDHEQRIGRRRHGISENYERRFRRKDGRTVWTQASATAILDDEHRYLGSFAMFSDITERKRVEEALRESEAFLKSLLDAIPIPVFYKDTAGRYTGFNRAYETFLGATKDQLIGKSVFDISPRELAEIYYAKDRELFERGGVQQYESQMKNWHGEVRDVIFNKAVFADSRGAIIGLIGAILDITERKRVEEALLKRNQELEKFEKLVVGRELRMVELKSRIAQLEEALKTIKENDHES